MAILIKSTGLNVSGYNIPEFEITENSFCRINMPFTMESEEDLDLLSILLGKKNHPSIKFMKSRPLYSGKINRHRESFMDIFKSNKAIKKLVRYYGISMVGVTNVLTSLNIEANSDWNRLPHFERCMLSFETALRCSSFIFFDTAGLDIRCSDKMCNHAIDKSKKGYTVVCLLYPSIAKNKLKDDFIVFL